jgi:hypothetical protein
MSYHPAVTDSGMQEPDFDVALSFAGEDRTYVEQVATILRDRRIKVFYDEFVIAEMWGSDLYEYFDDVYRRRAKFAVIFVSHHYARKAWTNHQRQSAQARALFEQHAYLLPVRLDNTDLPGLRPTVGYVDARKTSPQALVDLIEQKLVTPTSPPPTKRYGVPKGLDERRDLIAARPLAWEYLLFAGVLWDVREALEPKYRDHQLRYVRRSGTVLDSREEAQAFINSAFQTIDAELPRAEDLLSLANQEWAFGPRGEPGDPERIVHLGTRVVEFYEYMLDWAAAIRANTPPEEYRRVFSLLADFVNRPIEMTREFIDRYIEQIGPVPEQLEKGETVQLTLDYVLETDPVVVAEFDKEIKRLKRRRQW